VGSTYFGALYPTTVPPSLPYVVGYKAQKGGVKKEAERRGRRQARKRVYFRCKKSTGSFTNHSSFAG